MNFAGPFDSELSHVSPVSLGGDGFTFNKPTFIQHQPSDGHVVIPDAHLLFSGDYTRIGSDLIISGDGQKIVVGNYFKGETRPALTSKDGATLAGHIVDALTGHVHYAQANATAPAAGQVIGNVLKMSGSATAIRNGVSIELHIGDAVQKGDVIQTGSDSSIGMTFVDGSAFGMTSNARMVLNEMIYDPNGSSNSSLMSLVQGTITFVAGQTAKNGNMRVETPVATMGIRGTAVLVEIGANDGPTKFSVLVEPDGHTGSYNLYDKNTGDLIGTVSQAGQVTYVTSLGLGQPPSAIEQLKTLQDQQNEKSIIQQVFQLYFPNYKPDDSNPKSPKFGSNTSGNNLAEIIFTTNSNQQKIFLTQIELRFAVTDPVTGAVTYQNKIFYNAKASFSADSVFGSQAFVPTTESFKFADVVKIDDPDIGNAPFYDIGVPFVPGSAIIKSVVSTIPQMSEAFLKSLLSINQNTGEVTFDRQQFNFLDDGQTVTFKIQVLATSGPDSALVEIPFQIAGANDAPTIVIGDPLHPSDIAGGVTEDTPVGASALIANGFIAFQDFDLTDAHTATVALTSTASNLPGFVSGSGSNPATTKLGTFTIDPVSENLTDTDNHGSVGWHFTLADNDPTLQSLAKGQTITQTYTITIKDDNGVPVTQTVTITITGTNDAPELTADTAIHNTIEIPDTTGAPNTTVDTATGTLAFVDVDLSNTHQAGAALHLNADTTPSVSWSGGAYSGIPQATRDALANAMTATVSENNTDTDNHGSVNWTFTLPDHLLDFLAEGQTLTVTYDVTVTDNDGASSTTQVVIKIGAANDQPVISVIDSSGTVTEDVTSAPGILHDTGSVTFTDTDLTDTHTMHVGFNGAVGGNGASVSAGLLTALGTALSVPGSTLAAGVHTFDWDFALSNGLVQYLGAGETVTATYTITVKDGSGDNTTDTSAGQTVTVVITGTNDTPVITAVDVSGAVKEDTIVPVNTLHDSGSVTFTDVDATDHETATVAFVGDATSSSAAIPGALHSALQSALTLQTSAFATNNGTINWNFNLDNSLVQYLADGETVTATYTILVKDDSATATDTSAPQTVTVVITGTNDTPVITVVDVSGAVKEDTALAPGNVLHDTGSVTFADADLTDHATASVAFVTDSTTSAPIPGALLTALQGALTLPTNSFASNTGTINWNFDLDNSLVQYLADGETITVTYTITVKDDSGTATDTSAAQTVTVVITGTNDAPVIGTATLTGTVTEDATPPAQTGTETATGTIAFSDVDLTDTPSVDAAFKSTDYSSQLGSLTAVKTSDTSGGIGGLITWTFTAGDAAINQLAAGQIVHETYTVTLTDGEGGVVERDIVVTIVGANDDAIITVAAGDNDTGSVIEDVHSVTETATGTLSFSDVDLTDSHTITAAPVGSTLGVLTVIKTADTSGGTGGSLEWTYSVADSAIHYLAAGETATETFRVSVFDGTSTVTKDVVITIHGTNDVPVIAGVSTGDVTEDASVDNGYLKADGALTINDADHDQSTFVAQASTAGSYGTFTLDSGGHWTYAADNSQTAIQQLGASDTLTDSFTAHSLDGSASQVVTVTIHGTNDAPVLDLDISDTPDVSTGKHISLSNNGLFVPIGLNLSSLPPTGSVAISDVDSANFVSAKIVLADGQVGDTLFLPFETTPGSGTGTLTSGITWALSGVAGSSTDPLTLTLSGSYSAAAYVAAIAIVGFGTTGAGGDRHIDVTVNDGVSDSNTAEVIAQVTVPSDAVVPLGIGPEPDAIIYETYDPLSLVYFLPTDILPASQAVSISKVSAEGTNFSTLGSGPVTLHGEYFDFTFAIDGNLSVTFGTNFPNAYSLIDAIEANEINTTALSQKLYFEVEFANGAHQTYNIEYTLGDTTFVGDAPGRLAPAPGSTIPLSYFSVTDWGSATHGQSFLSAVVQVTFGTLSIDGTGWGGSATAGVDGHSLIISGTQDEINTNLSHLQYTASNTQQIDSLYFSVADGPSHIGPVQYGFIETGAPTLNVDDVALSRDPDGTVHLSGLNVSDPNETGQMTLIVGTDGVSAAGTIGEINDQLDAGLNYAASPSATSLSVLIIDSGGFNDTVNFVFSEASAASSVLTGTLGKDVIFSTTGNDTLTGLTSADNFVFAAHSGNDTITDFHTGIDHIVLNDYGIPFTEATFNNWLASQVTDTANGAVIQLDTNDSITLTGVAKASLAAHDFIIHPGGIGI